MRRFIAGFFFPSRALSGSQCRREKSFAEKRQRKAVTNRRTPKSTAAGDRPNHGFPAEFPVPDRT
jgi:hypothetical protein